LFVPFSFGFSVNISLGLSLGALLKGSCWDAESVAIPADMGNKGTAFGTKLLENFSASGKSKRLIHSSPVSHRMFSGSVTIVETWAEPVDRLQRNIY
jgi:hypothetical protein